MSSVILFHNWDFKKRSFTHILTWRCININRPWLLTKIETRNFIIVLLLTDLIALFFLKNSSTITYRVDSVCCQELWHLQNKFSKSSLCDIKRSFKSLQNVFFKNLPKQKFRFINEMVIPMHFFLSKLCHITSLNLDKEKIIVLNG